MIVYVDTSVALRVLFHEKNPVYGWGKWDQAYGSILWRVEAFRTVDRLRLSGYLTDREVASLAKEIQIIHETLLVVPLAETVLQRAGEAFPTIVGTLDALHLATALAVRESAKLDFFLTHDQQLGIAAQSLGFSVLGIQ